MMTSAWRNATPLIRQSTQDKHQHCAKNAFAIAKAMLYLRWRKALRSRRAGAGSKQP